MNDFREINRMTLYEYDLRMRAFELRRVDREREIHLQAWANWNVQAMKKSGKHKRIPVFKTFKQFFDYDKEIARVWKTEGHASATKSIMQGMKKQKERRAKNGQL